jgi:hypothetical protein
MKDRPRDVMREGDGEVETVREHLRSARHENEELRLINRELKREIQGSNETLRQVASLLRRQQMVRHNELGSPRFLLRKFWPALRTRLAQKLRRTSQAPKEY